jgi:PEP-CTERM motif
MKFLTKNTFGLAALLTLSTAAHAATITTLFSTGVDSAGAPVATDTVDAHYVLVSGTGAAETGNAHVIGPDIFPTATGTPAGPWLAATSNSNWIGSNATGGSFSSGLVNLGGAGNPLTNLYYETSFSMAGLDQTTATIVFDWNADNNISAFFINNTLTSYAKSNGFGAVQTVTLAPADIALLNGGTNTFKFVVFSTNGPTDPANDFFGLNVNFTTRTADAIPEPSALGLLGLGGIAALGLRRRRA